MLNEKMKLYWKGYREAKRLLDVGGVVYASEISAKWGDMKYKGAKLAISRHKQAVADRKAKLGY
jgi:hypothetical protein